MISLPEDVPVYLFTTPTDMRKGFDTLSALAQEHTKVSPIAGGLFVFLSRERNKVKVLTWDKDGYVLYYKRLEAGVFRVEEKAGYEEITGVDLSMLLQGMDLKRIKLRKAAEKGIFKEALDC